MAKRKKTEPTARDLFKLADYRHESSKRKNNPPAKIAAEGTVPVMPKIEYSYSPRRPPVLQFDPDGGPDALPELLAQATQRPLSPEEARQVAEALRHQEPWLEWAGKREQQAAGFAVDPVALHIHERVSAQAILRVAARQDVQRSLFADPEQAYHEAVQFYRHDIDWTNRLILGDSLQVMASLARREDLAGKVQMIYIDPPYGIKFASNFQPEVGRRDVKDNETDLTREPEMVKAYRDTWHLGIHSYLSYLRDRLIVARELLADTGSIFVQISDENLHRVRQVMDEVFGDNFCAIIAFSKTSGQTSSLLSETTDYLLWYARDRRQVRYRQLYEPRRPIENPNERYVCVETPAGEIHDLSFAQKVGKEPIPPGRFLRLDNTTSQTGTDQSRVVFEFESRQFTPYANRGWSTNPEGLRRMARAGYLYVVGNSLLWKRYRDEGHVRPITSDWRSLKPSGFGAAKVYVVQTSEDVVGRCLLMTTDPGDLVLDPTCGSGTTAYVAEQWGRRWITIDTSRVAIAIARQRILTARFDRYRVKGEDERGNGNGNRRPGVDPHPGFVYKTVPHITLKSIAQNTNLDPILAKHEPFLAERLAACNAALAKVSKRLRDDLAYKLVEKERREGKRAITDADRRRWLLPPENRGSAEERRKKQKDYTVDLEHPGWYDWEVPFDTDPDWPKALQEAVAAYRAAWRAKMDEVNACIAANAEQEELVDQPEVIKGVVRVSGPFTVEAVQPPELSLGDVVYEGKFGGEPDELEPTFQMRMVEPRTQFEVKNVEAYLEQMTRLLRVDGVRFPNNRQNNFSRLERTSGMEGGIHAEGRWAPAGQQDPDPEGRATVAVAFGPQYGPVTAKQVEELIRAAHRRGYEDLVIAGFSFDGAAQAVLTEDPKLKVRIHMAHIRPDVNPAMNGLLKEQPGSQLFSVFGQPRTKVLGPDKRGEYRVVMEGVDIYDPVTNSIRSTDQQKVAAWFLDGDYDGRTFCITQAFFPDRSAWEKLARALGGKHGVIDDAAFEAFSGTESLPFPAGKHACVAVKVIDPRGNEVMVVHRLN
ncbi:MAG: site-specific DNA-methyltransferase [Thermoguttaceae bacterium]|jgi:adenine-specific DNA-methyltransferase|nr:site-specific DNA-methyltransferase [Thermoguttaceae bacterium]